MTCHLDDHTFTVLPARSQIGFSVSYLELTDIQGSFKKFCGQLESRSGVLTSIKGNIEAGSVHFDEKILDTLISGQRFLYADKYPNITFYSTHIEQTGKDLCIRGILSLKHEKHEITLKGTYGGIVHENADDTLLTGLDLQGEILKTEFGILADDLSAEGRKVVGDKITLKLHLLGKTSPMQSHVRTSATWLAQ